MESARGVLRLGPPLSLRSGNIYKASGSILCSAMRDDCSGPGAPAWLGQVSRSSDRHSTVVLNVARRHRTSQIKPGRQGRSSRRAWPGRAMHRTRSEVCWREQRALPGSGADDEPEKLQMVRRRSTVRFRKGAPSSRSFFRTWNRDLTLRKVPLEWHSRRSAGAVLRGGRTAERFRRREQVRGWFRRHGSTTWPGVWYRQLYVPCCLDRRTYRIRGRVPEVGRCRCTARLGPAAFEQPAG